MSEIHLSQRWCLLLLKSSSQGPPRPLLQAQNCEAPWRQVTLISPEQPEVDFRLLLRTDGVLRNVVATIKSEEKFVQTVLLSDFLKPFYWARSIKVLKS